MLADFGIIEHRLVEIGIVERCGLVGFMQLALCSLAWLDTKILKILAFYFLEIYILPIHFSWSPPQRISQNESGSNRTH